MNLPAVRGVIRRRLLVNFRVDPDVMQRQLPAPFQVKRRGGWALAGICLIRLEQIRPRFFPFPLGFSSENAAHRVAVCWTDADGTEQSGVFIPRRDTSSMLNHLAGGRLFPGEQQRARFEVRDDSGRIDFEMRSDDGQAAIGLRASETADFPDDSCFKSLEDASAFFETGAVGYAARREGSQLDGLRLETETWRVSPLFVESVSSGYFADEARFPKGSVEFDCALLMRDIPHEWQPMPKMNSASPDCRPCVSAAS